MNDALGPDSYFHGTQADVRPGDQPEPGRSSVGEGVEAISDR